jgi:hypothetical protein
VTVPAIFSPNFVVGKMQSWNLVIELLIPLKVVSDSDLIPVAGSEVKPGVFGAKRRWRSYSA